MTSGPTRALSIGSIEGGVSPNMEEWRRALTRLTADVRAAAEGVRCAVNLNVVYQVPGDLAKPEFEGVRTGHFSKAKSWLIVQVALPEEAPDDPDSCVRRLLGEAVDAAERWARRRKIAGDLTPLRGIVARVSP